MATRTREVKASVFDNRIDVLNENALEASSLTHQVYRTASAILALVRDRMIDDGDSVRLSEYCFNVCGTLKTITHGKNTDDFSEPTRIALWDLERHICEIERTLRIGADLPHAEYNKARLEEHKQGIQEIFNNLLDENLDVMESVTPVAPLGSDGTATIPVAQSACQRLIERTFAQHELPSLIEAVFSSADENNAVRSLRWDDAQAFIDIIDEALDSLDFLPQMRKKCLKMLYKMCGHNALLPKSLQIPLCHDRQDFPLYRGGFADVWKGVHLGRNVAVKELRTPSHKDLQRVVGRFCKEVVTWKSLRHPNVLPLIGVTMTGIHFAMVSERMANGNVNEFVKTRPDADRLELLRGAARGLIYIHSQDMIHGDLKGANILIDQTGHARLADFGLLTIVSDPRLGLSSSSYIQGGTARWMSPELIAPERLGFKNGRPRKSSDCYALGMVIYETISGHLPFHEDTDLTVFAKVLDGKHPPREVWFKNSLWGMLELCWEPQPNARPSIEDVLRCLETEVNLPRLDVAMEEDGDGWDSTDESSCEFSRFIHSVRSHSLCSYVGRDIACEPQT